MQAQHKNKPTISVIFVNENKNENWQKNNKLVNEN